jgi:pyruvate dehydrogenase (quinone)
MAAENSFVEQEHKSEGLLPTYTDLDNPDFGRVARAMSLWGRTVTDRAELETAGDEWLAEARRRRDPILVNGSPQAAKALV